MPGNVFCRMAVSESTYPTLIFEMLFARNFFDAIAIEWGTKMNVTQLYIARHLPAAICVLIGMALLAIGARATLDLRMLEAAKVVSTTESARAIQLALIIGNGHYPDAAEPLNQPINDASGLADAIRRRGFDVDLVEDATKADMARAVERLKSRIKPGSVVMLFFGGYGVQSGRESYMIPIDATIWKESDVRHEGISVETVLDVIKERGARAKLVVLDASRRNPYERRFRSYSHGLAPITAPNNTLIISSNTPGKVGDDTKTEHSVLVAELLNELDAQDSVEGVFNKTRFAVSRVSNGEQMPSVSSSLLEDVRFSPSENSITSALPLAPPRISTEYGPLVAQK
jgi:Caspase domain